METCNFRLRSQQRLGCARKAASRRHCVALKAANNNVGENHATSYINRPPPTGPGYTPRQAGAPWEMLPNPFTPARPASALVPQDGAFKASGKTVVITGGSQGVGRATALLFAKKGWNVVVAARDANKLQYVAQDCAQAAGRTGAALAVPTDVTQEREVKDLVNAVLSKYESIDIVVNCAGIFARGAFTDTPAYEAKRLMETNYLGAYMVTQNFLPVLLKQASQRSWLDKPSVVFVGSFAGKVPMKYMSAFTASKFAVAGLAAAIRTEVEGSNVHVGLVHPGVVKSNFMERTEFYGKDSVEDRRVFRQVLRALPIAQSPQEVAESIYWCGTGKHNEVVVGLPFAAAAEAYRFTGMNPSAVPGL